jgi:DNA-directed RNA polymerase alpha subunit
MITKEEVLKAIEIIEKYHAQERQKAKSIGADSRSIHYLELNRRTLNCLKAANIKTIGELLLLDAGDLKGFRNVGGKCIQDINEQLKEKGIEAPMFTW